MNGDLFSECTNRSTQRENESAIYQQASPLYSLKGSLSGANPLKPLIYKTKGAKIYA